MPVDAKFLASCSDVMVVVVLTGVWTTTFFGMSNHLCERHFGLATPLKLCERIKIMKSVSFYLIWYWSSSYYTEPRRSPLAAATDAPRSWVAAPNKMSPPTHVILKCRLQRTKCSAANTLKMPPPTHAMPRRQNVQY